jgi:hypothetical protein
MELCKKSLHASTRKKWNTFNSATFEDAEALQQDKNLLRDVIRWALIEPL